MRCRVFVIIAVLAASVSAQSSKSAIPRTPDGHPDLQGVWTNATLTPMERPAAYAGKPTLTDAESRNFERTPPRN